MAIDEREFKKRKRRVEQARTARDRAVGQLEATMQQLKDEFNCATVEAAEAKATKIEADAATAEKAYDAAVEAFEEEWDEQIEG